MSKFIWLRKKPTNNDMKVILNATTLTVGGGVQVGASVISELRTSLEHTFLVLLSPAVAKAIAGIKFPKNFSFHVLDSPASLRTRSIIVERMGHLEAEFEPDFVLTIFGPSYWRPKAYHICGFALGWFIMPESPAHKKLSFVQKLKNWLIKKYKWRHFLNECDALWCETADVRRRLNLTFNFPVEKISVVGNTYNANFAKYYDEGVPGCTNDVDVFKMVTISAYYPNKNLEIIKRVIPYLVGKIKFRFILTIPTEDFDRIFSVEERNFVVTVGPIEPKHCPAQYIESDAVFLPTLLECFSATYPEAFVMRRPVLTSNLSFATSMLGDAAVYFDPEDPEDIANKILSVQGDRNLYDCQVRKGLRKLSDFTSAAKRAEELLSLGSTATVR